MIKRAVLLTAVVSTAFLASAQSRVEDCKTLRHHGKTKDAQSCFVRLVRSPDAFLQAEGYFGLNNYDEANTAFRAADRNRPNSAAIKAEWGRLFFEHYQPQDAAKLFNEAIEADPNYAPAYLGLARVFGERFDKRAVQLAQEALKHDANLAAAHELLAYLALEDSDPQIATDEAQKALALSPEALDGMAVLASIDWLNDKTESPWMARILKVNPVYGEAYAAGGHFLEINYRYEDAIASYRKALSLNQDLWQARSDLGVNLMRLAQIPEAREQLERCYNAHYRNPETVNSLRLIDTYQNYETFKTPTTELLLSKNEAPLLRPYIEPEFERALATYEKKYKFKLPRPVRLEVYPNHDDFVVRTLGLPGQGGLLGVTFGSVVTMDSPASRPAGQFNWGTTMWHELSHVYVITATHRKVPRWFTEGLAVHEEGVVAPEWGSRLTPDIISALQKKQLLPVAKLDRGFVRPEFPSQVLVSYYQAGKICDFIVAKWGNEAILSMIHSYADGKDSSAAIEAALHESPDAFDKQFAAWLDTQTGSTVKHFDEWKNGLKAAHASFDSGKLDEAIRQATTVRDFYPDYVQDGNAYELLAEAHTRKNEKAATLADLQRYRDRGGSSVATIEKLAQIEADLGRKKEAISTLERLNYIFPEDDKVHRSLASLALDSGDTRLAVRESEALLSLKAGDVAETEFQLARALNAAHRQGEAKEHVISSLEAAPDYKPAQHLLLELSQ